MVSAFAGSLNAQVAIDVSQITSERGLSVLPHAQWRYDATGLLNADAVWATDTPVPNGIDDMAWQTATQGLSLGYRSGALWVRFSLTASNEEDIWLQVNPTFLDQVTLYIRHDDDRVEQLASGDHVAISQRPLESRSIIFPLVIPSTGIDLLLRIQTTSALTLNADLWQPDALYTSQLNTSLFYGVVFGLVVLAVMVSLLSGLWTQQGTFYSVAAYLLCFGWVIFTLNGFDLQYLFPEHPKLTDYTMGTASFSVAGFLLLFVRSYLQIGSLLPWLARVFDLCIAIAAIGFLTSAFGSYPTLAPMFMLYALSVLLLTITTCIAMIRVQPNRAVLLLITFVPGMLAVLLQALRNLGYLPLNFWTTHLWPLSAMLQVPFTVLVVLLKLREDEQQLLVEQERTADMRRFYNLMAHELRTPLAVLETALSNMQLQLADQQAALTPRLQRARVAVARLNNLVDNALAENRLSQLTQPLQHETIEMDALLHDVASLALTTDRHRLMVDNQLHQLNIDGDPRWLVLALLNLIDNAIKYSPEGGTVTLQVSGNGNAIHFAVQDEGIGVDPASEPRLIERFFRAANAQAHTHISGLGIGLYLVSEVAQLHGGEVFYRRRDKGSVFGFSLAPRRPLDKEGLEF